MTRCCAIYSGSFNPVHFGHLSIARRLASEEEIDEVRIIPSPFNPIKDPDLLADPLKRLEEVRKAFSGISEKITISDIEYHLERPLYTVNTLYRLREQEPGTRFILTIGADNIALIEKWYRWEDLLRETEIWVYPRKGYDGAVLCRKYSRLPGTKKIRFLEGELYDISSTEIRNRMK